MNNATLDSITFDGYPGTFTNVSAGDVGCSVVVSGYKWLTAPLVATQANAAVRPYYTCQIIDNSLVPNQIYTEPSQPLQGSVVVAPDGSTLAVGLNSAGSEVGFWKISDPSVLGNWTASPTTVLDTNAQYINSLNHYAIQVSEYIAGTYVIDVYYFGNFGGGGGTYLTIRHWQSTNGGTTWSSSVTPNASAIPYAATSNFWIASGKPYQNNLGTITSTVFYINPNPIVPTIASNSIQDIYYQQNPGTGGYGTPISWAIKNINSQDWTLHSLDVALINGYWYVAFSGYHNILASINQAASTGVKNYNIYVTKILNMQNSSSLDIWTPEFPVLTADSSSPQNLNSFIFPQLFYDSIGNFLYLIFYGSVVSSISEINSSNNIGTSASFYFAQSSDFKNFSYPVQIYFNDGTVFGTPLNTSTSFFRVNNYFYLAGAGTLWQYVLNNTVADVTADILAYQINDNQQSASTVQLQIGNANNKWMGAAPTQNGYQALAKNKLINIMQGYYTGDSTFAVAPKNIFYIDDIQNNVNAGTNDLSFAGRDLYKLLNIVQTQFAFNYIGIKSYVDIFGGTTAGNYNVVSGNWDFGIFEANTMSITSGGTSESDVIFGLYQQTEANTIFSVVATLPNPATTGSNMYIYYYYISPTEYLRLNVSNNGSGSTYNWEIDYNGSPVYTGTFATGSTQKFPFYFVREAYNKVQAYVGSPTTGGQIISSLNTMTALGGEVDFTLDVAGFDSPGSIMFGCAGYLAAFNNFRYLEFSNSQNIAELVKTIATKCSVYNYKMPNQFTDYFFNDTNYSGTYTLVNRNLTIPVNTTVFKNDLQFSNGDISFNAIVDPQGGSTYYFDVLFMNTGISNANNNYFIRVQNASGYVSVSLYATYSGTQYLLATTGTVASNANNQRFDMTVSHKYRLLFYSSYIYFMVDEQVVFGWFDNNMTNVQTIGYLGFRTDSFSNSLLDVNNVVGIDLWTQINSFSINPGDDLETSIESLLSNLNAYFFSDLMGRFKVVLLNSTDPSTYTYQNNLFIQQSDLSDKEYYNQVTVIGAGSITATAQDASSIGSTFRIRNEVVTNSTITTYADAYTLALATLTQYNKYNNQYNPQQINNVGSEVYDVVTVVNTGNNSSNVNAVVRNYSQVVNVGGSQQSYYIQLGTGQE